MSTLSESVNKLSTLLPKLNASDAKFASSLVNWYHKHGNTLTPGQTPWVEKLVAKAEAEKAPAYAAPVTGGVAPVGYGTHLAVNVGGFEGVVAHFQKASEHLKHPKVWLSVGGTKVVLSLNGAKSLKKGHVSVNGDGKYPYRTYYGSVSPEGVYSPYKSYKVTPEFLTDLTALLTQFAKNPARVAKEYGKLTGHCCFCNKELGLGKEKRSVLVGFGPDCAEHRGLKAEWLAAADKLAKVETVGASAPVVAPTKTVGVAEQAYLDTLASIDAVKAAVFAPKPVPTLTVSPGAQKTLEHLAEGLAKAKEFAESLKATDATVTTPENMTTDQLAEELFPEYGTSEFQAKQAYDAAADQAKNDDDKAQDAFDDLIEQQTVYADVKKVYATLAKSDVKLAEELAKELKKTVAFDFSTVATCYLCDTPSTETKTLHGHAVCAKCRAELGGS